MKKSLKNLNEEQYREHRREIVRNCQKRRRAKAVKRGLCSICALREARPHRKTCSVCCAYNTEANRKRIALRRELEELGDD